MPLELRKQRDGRLRKTWYARYEVNGKRYVVGLGLKIDGEPPASLSLRDQGDTAFEVSRTKAQAKLDQLIEEARSKRDSAHLVERLYEMKTGEQIRSVKLSELKKEWGQISRRRELDERYADQCKSVLGRFVDFVRGQNPKADDIGHVTRKLALGFMDAEAEREVSPKTWNDTLKLLRATFKYLLPAGAVNPFYNMVTKETDTVFRKPFTPEELKAILDVCKDDDFIRPIIITGMCTAMRRGDCCLLRWKDVDLARQFITVKTAKTGQTVSIPIFPLLYEELQKVVERGRKTAKAQRNDGGGGQPKGTAEYAKGQGTGVRDLAVGHQETGDRGQRSEKDLDLVFPEQAAMYEENPDGITWRVKKVLAVALSGLMKSEELRAQSAEGSEGMGGKKGGTDTSARRPYLGNETASSGPSGQAAGPYLKLEEVSEEEARRRGHEFIGKLAESEKKRRMLVVFDAYMDGKKISEVVAAAGVSKGSVSGYLNEIEAAVGCKIVRGRPEGGSVTAVLKGDSGLLRVKREDGERRASVRDFHSFRVTWVTLALTAGVPLELVQKVTGHKTTDVVLKHYFQPGREEFRRTLQSAMPKLLTSGKDHETTDHGLQTVSEAKGQGTGDRSQGRGDRDQGAHKAAREEMRKLIAEVKSKGLRERMLAVWGRM